MLRRRDFRYLWAAQCGSQLAQNFIQFALLVVVYDLTGLTTAVAAVAVAFTFPGVLLSAPAGVYADRHDKRSLMMLTNLLRAGLLVLIPVSQLAPFLQHQAWPLLVITFLFSSVGQVFAPAEAASIPSLVSREQIQGAMSLFMTTVIFTLMLGSVLAPVCLILFGDLVPFYIAAGLFALAALSCWRIGSSLRAVRAGAGPQTHVFQEFQDGVGILRRSAGLRWGMIQLGLALIMVFTIYALGAPYLQKVLHRSPNDISIVLVPAMFGLVAMAGVLGQHLIRLPRRSLTVIALLTTGGCLLAMGILPPVFQADRHQRAAHPGRRGSSPSSSAAPWAPSSSPPSPCFRRGPPRSRGDASSAVSSRSSTPPSPCRCSPSAAPSTSSTRSTAWSTSSAPWWSPPASSSGSSSGTGWWSSTSRPGRSRHLQGAAGSP